MHDGVKPHAQRRAGPLAPNAGVPPQRQSECPGSHRPLACLLLCSPAAQLHGCGSLRQTLHRWRTHKLRSTSACRQVPAAAGSPLLLTTQTLQPCYLHPSCHRSCAQPYTQEPAKIPPAVTCSSHPCLPHPLLLQYSRTPLRLAALQYRYCCCCCPEFRGPTDLLRPPVSLLLRQRLQKPTTPDKAAPSTA